MKLALIRKHGGEALLVKAFLTETSGDGGNGSGNSNGSDNGLCTDNEMVRMVCYVMFHFSCLSFSNHKSFATILTCIVFFFF